MSVTFTVPILATLQKHQMFGQLLGIIEQFLSQFLVAFGGRAAFARAGDRSDRDLALVDLHQDFRAGAGNGKLAEIKKIHIRGGVGAP